MFVCVGLERVDIKVLVPAPIKICSFLCPYSINKSLLFSMWAILLVSIGSGSNCYP